MSLETPIPRDTRERNITLTDGQTVLGPIDFPIWDVQDVALYLQEPTWTRFQKMEASDFTVAPVDVLPGFFTVTLPAARPDGTKASVRGLRVPQRLTDVTRDGIIRSVPLEGELDRSAAVQQEIRRDMDRALEANDALDDAVTAAEQARDAAFGFREEARLFAEEAAESAEAAATFDPANYLPRSGGTLVGDVDFDAREEQRTIGFRLPDVVDRPGGYFIFARPSDGRLGCWDNGAERIVFEYDPAAAAGGGSFVVGTATMTVAGNLVMHFGMKASAIEYRRGTGNRILTADNVWEAAGYAGLSGAAGSTLAAGSHEPNFNAGINFFNVLGGNITIANPINAKPGQTGLIVLQQDATGGRTVAFGSAWKFPNNTVPSMSTGAGRVNTIAYGVLHSGFVQCVVLAGFVP